jgi:hypothetical protein
VLATSVRMRKSRSLTEGPQCHMGVMRMVLNHAKKRIKKKREGKLVNPI